VSLLFNRQANIIVGPRGKVGVKISDLRIVFKVEKNSEANPNTCTVSVYNMSQRSRSVFETKGNSIILSAGYTGSTPKIFTGDIVKVWTTKEGPDQITAIECSDGDFAINSSRFNGSFAPGATVESVFNQVVGSFGVGLGPMLGLPNTTYKHGLTVSGDSKTIMNDLTKKSGLEWSVQDNSVVVHPKNQPVFSTAVLLSSSTGLIGSPKRVKVLKYSTDPLLPEANKDAGVVFKSLLNSALKPGQLVKVNAVNLQGTFTLRKVTHQGDTHSSTWESDCEGI
jgi:hypothetical protein